VSLLHLLSIWILPVTFRQFMMPVVFRRFMAPASFRHSDDLPSGAAAEKIMSFS
jgi:hypothetical protein